MPYSDPLDRLGSVASLYDGLGSARYSYADNSGALKPSGSTTQNSCGTNRIVKETYFDGLGRVSAEKRTDGRAVIGKRRSSWRGDPFQGSMEAYGTEDAKASELVRTSWKKLELPVFSALTKRRFICRRLCGCEQYGCARNQGVPQ